MLRSNFLQKTIKTSCCDEGRRSGGTRFSKAGARGWLERRESVHYGENVDGIVVHRDDNDSVDILAIIIATPGRRSRFKKSRFTS